MALKLITDAATEPVNLTEAKRHCRVEVSDDDTLLAALITAARKYVEAVSRRVMLAQTWRLSITGWPAGDAIVLPKMPLQSVTGVVYTDSGGTARTMSSSLYTVDTEDEPGRVVLNYNEEWPNDYAALRSANPIQVTFVAGYSAATVPEIYKQAMLLLVGHWYENREAVQTSGAVPKQLELAVDALLMVDRGYM